VNRAMLQTQTRDVGYAVDSAAGHRPSAPRTPLLELALLTTGVVTAPGGLTGRGEDGLFQRERQPGDLEQFHPRRRRQQLGVDQSAGAQHRSRAAAGRRARRVPRADADVLGRIRQGRGAVHQRVDQAGIECVSRQRLRVLPRRDIQREHVGEQSRRPAQGTVQSAHRRRHARRTDRAQPDVLLRRLSGDPDEQALTQQATCRPT